jgi:hypothetical protein
VGLRWVLLGLARWTRGRRTGGRRTNGAARTGRKR